MGLHQLGVLTVGTLVPKEGGHTLSSTPIFVVTFVHFAVLGCLVKTYL